MAVRRLLTAPLITLHRPWLISSLQLYGNWLSIQRLHLGASTGSAECFDGIAMTPPLEHVGSPRRDGRLLSQIAKHIPIGGSNVR